MKIGDNLVYVDYDEIIINNEVYPGTRGLQSLVKRTRPTGYSADDLKTYTKLLIPTNALHQDFNPDNNYPRGSGSWKQKTILRPIWDNYPVEGLVFVKDLVKGGKLYLHKKCRCYRVQTTKVSL